MARDQGVDTMDPGVWAEMIRVNVTGTALVIRETLPALIASGGGSIVNVSSLAAWQREPTMAAYASSKIALHALTRHTAQTWGPKNISASPRTSPPCSPSSCPPNPPGSPARSCRSTAA